MGDAGHAVAPFTGEGMNSALESAALLARVVNAGGSCAQYDEQRREDAHALWDIALRNKTIVVGTPRSRGGKHGKTLDAICSRETLAVCAGYLRQSATLVRHAARVQ